jgi:ribosomal protein S18 acetylase RimI-like enzyme
MALEEIIADLSCRGISRVFLETEGRNDRARRFYGRHGFLEETSVWMSRVVE